MADSADLAGAVIDAQLSHALSQSRLPNTVATDPWCEECGEEIPQPRRFAVPWATTCIECQSIREAKLQHRR